MSRRRVLRQVKKATQVNPTSITAFFHQQQSINILSPTQYVMLAQDNPSNQKKYDVIRKTASELGVATLSANQVRYSARVCVIHKNLQDNCWYSPKYNNYQDYRVYINPKITWLSCEDVKTQVEQCASFPFLKFKVPRYNIIKIQYKDANKKQQEQQVSGFVSRVFQQSIDKLWGRSLFNWRMHFGDMYICQQVNKYFPKSQQWIQQYNDKVKSTLKQFPELNKMQTLDNMNKKSFSGEIYSFEQDYHYKITKHFTKQFALFNSRIQAGLINIKGNNDKK